MNEWAPKRFWKTVNVEETPDGFAIRLDDKPVRTPGKRLLSAPTREMAEAIAAEWEAQTDVIDPRVMPWTRSANSAIDKVAFQRAEVEAHLIGYAGSDLLSYRAQGPEELTSRQAQDWDPVLDWVAEAWGTRLAVTAGVMPVAQDKAALDRLAGEMTGMSDFQLTGFHDLVTLSGSYLLALAGVHRYAPPEVLWDLSRVDEAWQIEQWGADEEAEEMAAIKREAFLHAGRFYQSA